MYKATIKTKYNTIILNIENTEDPDFKEIIEQPYVIEIKVEQIKTKEELIKERDELLSHVVGMSYNTEKAKELTKRINKM